MSTREQTTSPCSSLVSTITITEPSHKSTRQTKQNGQSAQPVIELDHNRKLTNIASTSGLRSSGRKRISRKILADGQSNCKVKNDKRKSMTQSSKAVKKVKQQKEAKTQVVTLKVNCTESGCKTILNSHELWKQHLSTVHGQMPYKQLEHNARHNQHGQAEYPCTECEAVYKSQNLLNLHWSKYHLPGKFQCSTCKFVGNFWRKVHNHYRKKHFSRKCQCTHEGCNQTFKFEHNLVNHQRIHSGEKPYRCTWHNCGMTFNQSANAVRHVRVKHFRLPETVKVQKKLNIIDERDPNDYIQVS